ncbi:hypothetical protein C8T65DRAFT_740761 [Cerioporus squamosus]|nr:hypothetical protein C8T65DRAFT_740761 [Cerioporus squamosus]
MSDVFTPTTKFMNVRVHWAPNSYNDGVESHKLRWIEGQVVLAEVTPHVHGLIVCDAVRVGDIHVRRIGAAGMVCKNIVSTSFTMDTVEHLHTATFTETAPTTEPVHFHIRFPTLTEYLEFTRAVNNVKLDAEGLRAELEDGFTAVFNLLPAA